jgi:hypothetical protein
MGKGHLADRTGERVQAVALLLIAALIGYFLAGGFGEHNAQTPSVGADHPSEGRQVPGTLDLPDLGLTIHFPSEWTGEDLVISGEDVHYAEGRDWTVHAYTRQEGDQAFVGEGPSLLVRVVTSDTEAGRAAISTYFETLSNLREGAATVAYDVAANKRTEMIPAGSISGGPLIVKSTTDAGPPFASQAYYQLNGGRLYVIAYARSKPSEIVVDQPLIQEILGSLSIAD